MARTPRRARIAVAPQAPPSTSERWLARSSTRESPSAAAKDDRDVTTEKRRAGPLPARTSTIAHAT